MKNKPINIAVIGAGKWGNHLLETALRIEGFNVKYVCCRNRSDVKPLTKARIIFDDDIILNDTSIEGVIIATQPEKHFLTALKYLRRGLKVFIEKPLTLSYKECSALLKAAKRKRGSGVMVGNKLIYSPAVNAVRSFILKNNMEIRTISSRWLKSCGVQKAGIFFDICYHHINLIDYLIGRQFDDLKTFTADKAYGIPASGIVILRYGKKVCAVEATYNNHYDFYEHMVRVETDKGTVIIEEKERKISVFFDNKGISRLEFRYKEDREMCVEGELVEYHGWLTGKQKVRFGPEHDLKTIKYLSKKSGT